MEVEQIYSLQSCEDDKQNTSIRPGVMNFCMMGNVIYNLGNIRVNEEKLLILETADIKVLLSVVSFRFDLADKMIVNRC